MYTRHFSAALLLLLGALLQGCASGPRFAGLGPDELFDLGAAAFADQDWDEAVRVFERYVFADPTHEHIVEGRMYLARAYFNRGDYLTAVSEFSRILDRHPGSPQAPQAGLGVCKAYVELSPDIQRDQSFTQQAVGACQNVVSDFGGSEASIEAEALRDQMREKLAEKVLVAGQFYFKRKMWDSGIIYFNDVLTDYPRTEAAAQALLRLYQSYLAIGWDSEAETAKDRLLREFPDSDAAAELQANGEGGDPGTAAG